LKEFRPPKQTETTRSAGLFGRLREKLAATQRSFTRGLSDLLLGSRALDDSLFEELETLLLSADVGVETTQYLLQGITEQVSRQQLTDSRAVYHALRHSILSIVKPCSRKLDITPVVTHRLPLRDYAKGFDLLTQEPIQAGKIALML